MTTPINTDKLDLFLIAYRKYLETPEYNETYKWKILQTFQQNWDLDAPDLAAMIDRSLQHSMENLWAGANYYPKRILQEFVKLDPDRCRAMFSQLFDEEKPLSSRLHVFRQGADQLLVDLSASDGKERGSHYQDARAMLLYLSLRYPERYYLYKKDMVSRFFERIEYSEQHPSVRYKKGDYQAVEQYLAVAEQVRSFLQHEKTTIETHLRLFGDQGGYDTEHHLLTQDVIYCIAHKIEAAMDDQRRYWWLNADPGIWALQGNPLGSLHTYTAYNQKGNKRRVFKYFEAAQPGDLMIGYASSPVKEVQALLRITRSLQGEGKDSGIEFEVLHQLDSPIGWDVLSQSEPMQGAEMMSNNQGSLFSLKPEEFEFIQKLVEAKEGPWDFSPLSMAKSAKKSFTPLNQILYGPPGTGKTYQTMSRAVAIIDGEVPADRAKLRQRYRELMSEGRIAFTTFHQSFSYEEFVEGIRAEAKEGGVSYAVKPGVFLKTSREAQLALAEQLVAEDEKASTDAVKPDYEQLYEAYVKELQIRLKEGAVTMETSTNQQMEVVELTTQGNLNLRHQGYTKSYTVSQGRLKKLWQRFQAVSEIQNVHHDIRDTIGGANTTAYWVVFNDFKHFEANWEAVPTEEQAEPAVSEGDLDGLDFSMLAPEQLATVDRYVLIIDEINRGNIAKILGELITLLEPSKRLGGHDEQRVILPYSKQRFGVPANLHLIGTMNTADRSITQLDTALRRRFDFQEVMPQPELLAGRLIDGGVDLQLLLQTLNHRIEYLYDRNHTLGHAYFLGITSVRDLNHVFRDRVLPLLQEYFYGEWEKICLVLGDHPGWKKDEHLRLLQAKTLDGNALFGQAPDLYQQPQHYHLNPSLLAGEMPAEAFVHIYQQGKEGRE